MITHKSADPFSPPDVRTRTVRALLPLVGLVVSMSLAAAEPRAHWAFVPPRRPALPAVKQKDWPANPLDVFVLAALEARGWNPSSRANLETLGRRVTLDLSGLPPAIDEVLNGTTANSDDEYRRLVDRLLASPRFGERMAVPWLDAARYADTHGFLVDAHRDMWRWRDWVIEALNANMPFDQFTIEQLAGDLLPNPTRDQVIATGFNRNHMINYENGADADEYRVEYVADRASTTASVWMGLTFQCARCHDHKYDPVSLREFYQWSAFFNQVPEQGLDGSVGNATPFLVAPTRLQEEDLRRLESHTARLRAELAAKRAVAMAHAVDWEPQLLGNRTRQEHGEPLVPFWRVTLDSPESLILDAKEQPWASRVEGKLQHTSGKRGSAGVFDAQTSLEWEQRGWPVTREGFTWTAWIFPTTQEDTDLLVLVDDRERPRLAIELREQQPQFRMIVGSGEKPLVSRSRIRLRTNRWQHLALRWDGTVEGKLQWFLNGSAMEAEQDELAAANAIPASGTWRLARGGDLPGFRGLLDEVQLFPRAMGDGELWGLADADPLRNILAVPRDRRSPEQQNELADNFLRRSDVEYGRLTDELAKIERETATLRRAFPTTMVMRELIEPRPTFILRQGKYDRPGDRVEPATPTFLLPLQPDQPRNRLGLARWLVDRNHPLTARVTVNRLWQLFFGRGLVATPEDFGSRGEVPSHPELLDWLALELIESGWNIKHLVRLIVTSETYRQASVLEESSLRRDPENIWLGRAPRLRFEGEAVRDLLLATSGLLDGRVGGASVLPYQPAGLWEEVSFNPVDFSAQVYVQSRGADLYRRGMYTFWKRTLPPPALALFDAPSRETCSLGRTRTNSPLQALVLMNETLAVEAARQLAERGMRADFSRDATPVGIAARMIRVVLARDGSPDEIRELSDLYGRQRLRFQQDRAAALRLLSAGESSHDRRLDLAEHAAWTIVANVLLSLDEAVTRN